MKREQLINRLVDRKLQNNTAQKVKNFCVCIGQSERQPAAMK